MMFEPSYHRLRKGRRAAARTCQSEALESRIAFTASADPSPLADLIQPLSEPMAQVEMPVEHDGHQMYDGGVMITPTEIRTHQEIIPRFAANPTITALRTGSWSDPSLWSLGRVPRAGDRVAIGEGISVVYNVQSDIRLDSIEISGALGFHPLIDTRMVVANLTVMPSGLLQIGSEQAPISDRVQAELIIADKPLDLAHDPRQFGTGLIALGKVRVHGAALNQTWRELSAEATAGARVLYLNSPVNDWKPGDTLVLPDSRQVPYSAINTFLNDQFPPQWEEVVIDQVIGHIVLLKSPLKYDHRGARNVDGQLEMLPHVALLDRNVTIRSENPEGTRGHSLFTARADVDIRYARFLDLGRTNAFRDLDSSQFDAHGNVTHLGSNQVGRYAVHFHHVMGPKNELNVGYQFQFVGNTVESSRKWAVAVHGTSFGLVDRNVVYQAQGSGFVTEDGSEIGNVFSNNIALQVQGTHSDGKSGTAQSDYGRGGAGFWFRRGGNTITGNVAANNTFAGFVFSGYNLTPPRLPLFRGAEVHDPEQSIAGDLTPDTIFANNEAYGLTSYGLWAAYVAGNNLLENQPATLVSNLRLWNISSRGVWAYHTARMTFDGLLMLEDMNARTRNDTGVIGMDFRLYENLDLIIKNSRIEGAYYGIVTPTNDNTQPGIERPTVIESSYLKNYVNIYVSLPQDGLPTYGNVIEVRGVAFQLVTQFPNGLPPSSTRPPANIDLRLAGKDIDYTHPSIVRVYDYNRKIGDNFQVFYKEQAANYILPQTDPKLLSSRDRGTVGSLEAGLTNAQNWSKYGIAMAGAVAPSTAKASRGEILGLIDAIQSPTATPRVLWVTPWNGAVTNSGFLRVRYNVDGQLPTGAKVYLRLDGGEPIDRLRDGGFFNMKPGLHAITAYIGDSNGTMLTGTLAATSRFLVAF